MNKYIEVNGEIHASEKLYDSTDRDIEEVIRLYNTVFGKEAVPCLRVSTYGKNRISDMVRHYSLDTIKEVFQYIKENHPAMIIISMSHFLSSGTFDYCYERWKKERGKI